MLRLHSAQLLSPFPRVRGKVRKGAIRHGLRMRNPYTEQLLLARRNARFIYTCRGEACLALRRMRCAEQRIPTSITNPFYQPTYATKLK